MVSILLGLSVLSLGSARVFAGELPLVDPYIPRPYTVMGLSLNGSGYNPISEVFGDGVRLDSLRFISNIEMGYNNARKVNDGTVNNRKKHSRSAQARMFYRMPSGLYIGGGVQWSQLSTTNYSKEAWRTALGVGKDVLHDTYSLRLQALYVTKGTDKLNGTQGPEISLTYPSPTTNHRFFFRPVLGIYYFHTTITDFSDLLLMKAQGRDHHVTGYMAYEFVFRF